MLQQRWICICNLLQLSQRQQNNEASEHNQPLFKLAPCAELQQYASKEAEKYGHKLDFKIPSSQCWTSTPQHWRHLVTRVWCRNSPFDDEKRGAEVNSDASLLNRILYDYFHLIKSLLKAASPFRVCEKKEKNQEISTQSIENLKICEWVSLTLQMHGTLQKFMVEVNC